MTDKERLVESGYGDVVVFESPDFDGALVGISNNNTAIYDYDLMVESLVKQGMSIDDAVEFIDSNTIRSLPYLHDEAPIILYRLDS